MRDLAGVGWRWLAHTHSHIHVLRNLLATRTSAQLPAIFARFAASQGQSGAGERGGELGRGGACLEPGGTLRLRCRSDGNLPSHPTRGRVSRPHGWRALPLQPAQLGARGHFVPGAAGSLGAGAACHHRPPQDRSRPESRRADQSLFSLLSAAGFCVCVLSLGFRA